MTDWEQLLRDVIGVACKRNGGQFSPTQMLELGSRITHLAVEAMIATRETGLVGDLI